MTSFPRSKDQTALHHELVQGTLMSEIMTSGILTMVLIVVVSMAEPTTTGFSTATIIFRGTHSAAAAAAAAAGGDRGIEKGTAINGLRGGKKLSEILNKTSTPKIDKKAI